MRAQARTPTRDTLWRAARDLVTVAGPLSLLTALLYYFGRASAQSFYEHFGISLSTLDLSTTSYLMSTGDTLFRPAATVLLAALLISVAHALYRRLMVAASPARRSRLIAGNLVIGAVAAAYGVTGVYGSPRDSLPALALACGIILIEYGLWSVTHFGRPSLALRAMIGGSSHARHGLTVTIVAMTIFWAVTIMAHRRGAANAQAVENALPLMPQAVVYSEKDLNLPGPQVNVTRLAGDNNTYRFRYNGLRPLIYANDRWFLLPVGWRHDNGSTVIVIEDAPSSVRVDLAPGTTIGPIPR